MELQFSLACDLLFKSHERDSLFNSFASILRKWKDFFLFFYLLFLSHRMEFNDKEEKNRDNIVHEWIFYLKELNEKLKEMSKRKGLDLL